VNLENGIEVGEIQDTAHERIGTGKFQICVLRSSPGMQKCEFTDASAVDGSHTAEIEHHLAAVFKHLADHTGKSSGLVAIDEAALAMNDHHIAAISGFQTEFQLRLLRLCSEGSHTVRLQPCFPIRVYGLHAIYIDARRTVSESLKKNEFYG